MNLGKIPNSILKRSVLKLIKNGRKEVISGPGIGMDCGIIEGKENSNIAIATSDNMYGVYRVVNNLSASGAECAVVTNNIIMPNEYDEQNLKVIIGGIQEQCTYLNVQIIGGHTEISNAVIRPIVSITGVGYIDKDISISSKNVKPNQDVIMTKWIGIEGTRIIAELKREEILKIYTPEFLDQAVGQMCEMSIVKESKIAVEYGVTAMHDVAEGGIFGALWDMAEAGKVGLEIDFKKIKVKQEIIEICELFDKNPYEIDSSGCLLMTYENGYDIVKTLKENGISATIIGRTTDTNDKIIYNNGEKRFLDTPKQDEIYHI